MQGNDLSGSTAPVVYVVWEGLLATTSEDRRLRRYLRSRRYERAVGLFETHTRAVVAMWQVMHRGSYGLSVISYLPPGTSSALRDRLAEDHVPYSDLLFTTPADFARRMPYMPWLAAVIDPDPAHTLMFGSFGRHVPPEHAEMIGWLQ